VSDNGVVVIFGVSFAMLLISRVMNVCAFSRDERNLNVDVIC